MTAKRHESVVMIPVDQVNIVNTRTRAKSKFREIVASIKKLVVSAINSAT